MSGTAINYPAKSSQFLALLEQQGKMFEWGIKSDGGVITFRLDFFGDNRNMRLVYTSRHPPRIVAEGIDFKLLSLFDKGQPWDPDVYRNNPYMPNQHKRFLDALFGLFAASAVPVEPPVTKPWQHPDMAKLEYLQSSMKLLQDRLSKMNYDSDPDSLYQREFRELARFSDKVREMLPASAQQPAANGVAPATV